MQNMVPVKDAAKLIGVEYATLLRRVQRNRHMATWREGRVWIPRELVERLKRIKELQDQIHA